MIQMTQSCNGVEVLTAPAGKAFAFAAAAWRSVADTMLDASRTLELVPDRSAALQPPAPAPSLAIDEPSLDIGF